jgi:pyruvate formate lyase activating enzyme
VLIPGELGVCLNCIREKPEKALENTRKVHARSRSLFGLPEFPPADPDGIACRICVNQCRIGIEETGYCGLRKNKDGKMAGVTASSGKLSWYHDPLPTNCVADWVCPAGTGAGYPEVTHKKGPETGYKNLAVFMHACSFNCLYCQNWHFKQMTSETKTASVDQLINAVDDHTSCVCYFGGDPSPQLPYLLKASKKMLEQKSSSILRICWETNGSMDSGLLDQMIQLSLTSGGCIKFDIKAFDDALHQALTGVSNSATLNNFKQVGREIHKRPVPPLLIASTLVVPGHIDEIEVGKIAGFIASVNKEIPYRLLAFHPQFYMKDLPITSLALARKCEHAAKKAGLKTVSIGNVHLLT